VFFDVRWGKSRKEKKEEEGGEGERGYGEVHDEMYVYNSE